MENCHMQTMMPKWKLWEQHFANRIANDEEMNESYATLKCENDDNYDNADGCTNDESETERERKKNYA